MEVVNLHYYFQSWVFLEPINEILVFMVIPPIQSYSMEELVGYLRLHLISLGKLG